MKTIFISWRFFFCAKPVKIYIFLNSAKKNLGDFFEKKKFKLVKQKVFFSMDEIKWRKKLFRRFFFFYLCKTK